MNAITPGDTAAPLLIDIIELKWLLSGHGIRLHVERLQADPEYARSMLDRAAATPNAALCDAARHVRRCLGLETV